MNNLSLALAVLLAITTSGFAHAAKPVKITPGSTGDAGGASFRNYIVECSNGKKKTVTSWDNGKKWCVGENSQDNCAKKQIKSAKTACKLD